MTQTISRIYSSRENAAAAVKELKGTGFRDCPMNVVPPLDGNATDGEPAGIPEDQIVASIMRGEVVARHAAVYADGVREGGTVVSVRAPFGSAAAATTIMEKHSPTETGLEDQGYEKTPPDPAAPLSSACGWTVLSGNPTPLSSMLGLPVLSSRRSPPKPDRDLPDNPAPFSKRISMRVLSDKPAILSERFGWRLLLKNSASLSGRLGWPLLSGNQKAPQKRFGLPLLSDNPAPLSSRLGWKLLSKNPAPLSAKLHWRVLSSDRSD